MEGWLSDPAVKAAGSALGVLLIALTVVRGWLREQKNDAATRDGARAAAPALMHGLALGGTPMAALAGPDAVEATNDLAKASELNTAALVKLTIAIDALGAAANDMRREMRESQIAERAYRDARRDAERRR